MEKPAMMIIDPKLLEQLETSTCYGIAHDPNNKECKMCDVQQECAAKSAGNRTFDSLRVLKPETAKAMEKAREMQSQFKPTVIDGQKVPKPKKSKELPPGFPDTKKMSIEELEALLKERGGTCKFYENPAIYKMRLIMALKETYQ